MAARRRRVGPRVPPGVKVTFCVRGVTSPMLANIYLHYGAPGQTWCFQRVKFPPRQEVQPPHRESSLGSEEATNRTKRRQSDERAVTKVKQLNLVKYLSAGRQRLSGWQAPVGTPSMARWPETAAGSESTARSEMEASRDLGDPLRSWSLVRKIEYAGRYGLRLRRQTLQCEVGFAGSTRSAGKPRTWGSGETDEDWLEGHITCTHGGRSVMSTQLGQIAKRARLDRKARFTSLAHLLTPEFLKETWGKMNRRASGGVDGRVPSSLNAS